MRSVILLCLLISPAQQAAADGVSILFVFGPSAPLKVADQTLNRDVLEAFYAGRGFAPAWDGGTDQVGLGPQATAIFETLVAAADEGLDPADYHVREIAALASSTATRGRTARDLLLTDGLFRYLADQSGGRLKPGTSDERAQSGSDGPGAEVIAVAAGLRPDALRVFLAERQPRGAEYVALKAALAPARRLAGAGGWQSLPEGGTIHPGDHDAAVPALRLRLAAEGWKVPTPRNTSGFNLYDKTLLEAVATFQRRHGLKGDGVIGDDTREALNVSAQARVDQIMANLERARWMTDLPAAGRSVEVNIAGYRLRAYDGAQIALTMPVVVGKAERKTPVLESRITYIVVNPSWTVPPTILRKDILPRLEENPDYLSLRGLERHELGDGRYRLVQPPGPRNPLGRYKFVLPNPFDIYLHDSPEGAKFHREVRTFSSGCVRVGDAAALAIFLLDNNPRYTPDRLNDLVAAGTTRTIALDSPVPVSLVYKTAWLDERDGLIIANDPYGRDQRLLAALKKDRAARPRGKSPELMARSGAMSLAE